MTSPTPDRTPRIATLEEDHLRITVAGRERAVTIVGPPPPVAAAPAILYFHGSNQTAASGRAFTGGTFDGIVNLRARVVSMRYLPYERTRCASVLCRLSLPAGDHRPRRVALLAVRAQLP